MEKEPKKTNWWGIGAIVTLGLVIASGFAPETTQKPVERVIAPTTIETKVTKPIDTSAFKQRTVTETQKPNQADNNDELSNDNYYTNVDGNTVHSPAYSSDGDVPAGASARCNDGTYSFSQNRRGTCSRHGGVASWL